MNGHEAIQAIGSQGLAVPIVTLTANAMVGDREKCPASGADAYVPKPIDADVLIEVLAGLIARR